MKPFYTRPVQYRALTFLVLLLMALAILSGMIWRNLDHFKTVLSHVNYAHSVQHVSAELQQSLIDQLAASVQLTEQEGLSKVLLALNSTISEMDGLMANSDLLLSDTRKSLQTVRSLIADLDNLKPEEKSPRLIEALKIISATLDNEILQREKLLTDISDAMQTDLDMALITFIVILTVAILFLHRRILHPLNDLKQLLQRLTEENYTRITTDHLDPLLLPVFDSYNEMVNHLAELEEAKRLYAESLQREVRLATQALLEQQTSLARAERLAAIGEVAAELAHEIRNPLAGIQIAFSNLRREIHNNEQCERMDMIGNELKRLARLLNDILDQSRHVPEIPSEIDVAALIRDLVALTRYQIAESIVLQVDAPAKLMAYLPESGLRQALLNLILNSAEAMEGFDGVIFIKAGQTEEGLKIEVLDNGPGFSKELLEHGIRPFRTSRRRGTGLGLSMVQRFVKEIGGAIGLTNQPTQGACVSLYLPVGRAAGAVV